MDAEKFLGELERVIEARKGSDPDASYVAALLRGDEDRLLKKLLEEAGELALACKGGEAERIGHEAADLLFHLLVALSRHGLGLGDVARILQERAGTSGLDEKSGRAGRQG